MDLGLCVSARPRGQEAHALTGCAHASLDRASRGDLLEHLHGRPDADDRDRQRPAIGVQLGEKVIDVVCNCGCTAGGSVGPMGPL